MKALNSVFARAVKSVPTAHPVGGGQILSVPLQWNGGGATRAKIAKVLGVLIWDEEDRCQVQVVDHQKHWQKS